MKYCLLFLLTTLSMLNWVQPGWAKTETSAPANTPHSNTNANTSQKTAPNPPPAEINSDDSISTRLISIQDAALKKSILAFPTTLKFQAKVSENLVLEAQKIRQILKEDLDFSNLFQFVEEKAYVEDTKNSGISEDKFKYSDWKILGTEFLLKTAVDIGDSKDGLALEVRLYDVFNQKKILSQRYQSPDKNMRFLAHNIANDVVEVLTGQKGMFTTKIVFTSDKSGSKEVWISDYDGYNPQQLTFDNSIVVSPSFAPKSNRILYSLFEKTKQGTTNVDLYIQNMDGKRELLSSRAGLNTGAVFLPEEDFIILTVSFLGNPDLFLLNIAKKTMKPLASSKSMDLEPSVSSDGKWISFSSARFGRPMVFTMPLLGTNPLRTGEVNQITFAGRYNASPSISPDGKKIAFAGYDKDHFDIFLVNSDGTDLQRLTMNGADNENPFFSPDGQHITFSSNRIPDKPNQKGKYNLYLIHIDGSGERRITFDQGSCQDPSWSPFHWGIVK